MTHVVELDNYFSTVITQERKESEVAQSCPTLCDPVDCSPPGSSVHGILQARILEWVPGDLPHPGIHPGSPALQADALPSEPPGKSYHSKGGFSSPSNDYFTHG